MASRPEIVLNAGDIVGESIPCDPDCGALLWVDIGGKRMQRLSLSDARHEIWPMPDFPTSVGRRRDGVPGGVRGVADSRFAKAAP